MENKYYEVHTCDGQLKSLHDQLDPEIEIVRNVITEEQRTILFNWWGSLPVSITSKNVITTLVGQRGTPANYDNTNGFWVEDIMLLIAWRLHESTEIEGLIGTIDEQVGDILGGPCPQGRMDRLLQIYVGLN